MTQKPRYLVFFYFTFGLIWVLSSDRLIRTFSSDGQILELLHVGKGVFFISVTAFLINMSVRRQQKNLRHSEKQYKSLFYANPNPLWIFDVKTLQFLEVNNAAVLQYGYSRDEFSRMSILDIRSTAEHTRLLKAIQSVGEYENAGNWCHIRKNGQSFTASITSHTIEFNNIPAIIVMAQDVTMQVRYEERLKLSYEQERKLKEELESNLALLKNSFEAKQRLAEVVDRINNMVVITDPSGQIIWVNHAFTTFTGYSFDESVGQSTDFLHGPGTHPDTQQLIMTSLRNNQFRPFEILNYTKSGHSYWAEINVSAICNEDHVPERYISIHNVITTRKNREEKIRASNQALRRYAWTISHGVRKPLASILSLVGLSKEVRDIAEMKEIISLLGMCSCELDGIIQDAGKDINDYETMN